ncbi:MAG: TetR/AcrR family transcriptional regulator [Bacillota bacterium]|nr:TetR/AcrR family transcriptional regulator [Bacillota bacterium]
MKQNPTRRDLQAIETRQRIFDTAFQMISEFGFDNVTVEGICKQSGVAKGLFYHYFDSKADIIIETYRDVDDRFSGEIDQLPLNTKPIDRILLAVNFQARYAEEKGLPFTTQIYKHQIDTGASFFSSEKRAFYQLIRRAVVDGQENGDLRSDHDPDEITRLVLCTSRGITYDWCLRKGEYDLGKIMERYFRIFTAGFQA